FPERYKAHDGLGLALRRKGRLNESIVESREAIRLNKNYGGAHCNLGLTLQAKGEFREALLELRSGHELISKDPGWRNPSADWVRQCERLVELDEKLPGFLEGKTTPASAAERIELAELCSIKRLNCGAARFYEGAFTAQPKLSEESNSHRYNAACAAA